jgi:protein-S-isoprenylcysteine O-methyltransferase Ste14
MNDEVKKTNPVAKWFSSNSNRTFILYPIVILLIELILHQGNLQFVPWGVVFLLWGYLQFKFSGKYRNRLGRGGPGLKNPPEALVTSGIYAYTRNPMYLGHFIYITGIAITLQSLVAVLLLIFTLIWYQPRVRKDEERLVELFGDDYEEYRKRVKRWLPAII